MNFKKKENTEDVFCLSVCYGHQHRLEVVEQYLQKEVSPVFLLGICW